MHIDDMHKGETTVTFTLFTPGQAFAMNDFMSGRPAALATPGGEMYAAPRTLVELDMDRTGVVLRYADGTEERPAAGIMIAVGGNA